MFGMLVAIAGLFFMLYLCGSITHENTQKALIKQYGNPDQQ
jgi:hypothetical protein